VPFPKKKQSSKLKEDQICRRRNCLLAPKILASALA